MKLLKRLAESNKACTKQFLYTRGARAFWVHNTGPIGCLPSTLLSIQNPPPGFLDENGCVKKQNVIAMEFNRQLRAKVTKLRAELPLAAISYVDVYAAKYKLITTAKQQGKEITVPISITITPCSSSCSDFFLSGFVDARKYCCGYNKNGIAVGCGGTLNLGNGTQIYGTSCEDLSSYVSWDGLHYTEAANRWLANLLMNGSFSDPPVPINRACHRAPLIHLGV